MINPLIPMLAITGRPTQSEIVHIVDRYADCGFEQLMLYPRDGCELSYLTDEWFDVIEAFIIAGKKHSMNFWLYDEYNYPSGGCKGRVMAENSDFCLKYIKAEFVNGKYEPKLIKNEKYPDILNPVAMDFFIEITHKKYEEKFKKYFGKEIRGIFTDEPSFYYGVWEADELPYYREMPEDYLSATGRDFGDDYNDYYSQKGAPDFLRDCYRLLSHRMYASFTQKISAWCSRNNLYMTGHLMNDALPTGAVQSNGNLLKQLSGFSLPAVDDIFSNSLSRSLLSSFSVIQYASYDKDGAGAELFALGPCDISFSKMCMMLWYASLFGVNHYFLAIAHLDVRGNAYRKFYFNNFSPDNPCSFAYGQFGEEAKKAAIFARKEYTPEVYVRYPSDAASYELFADRSIDKRFGELLEALKRNQLQYMLLGDEADSEKPIIEVTGNGFSLNGTDYADVQSLLSNFSNKNLYTLPDGTLTDDIMVRVYADGTCVILNLTERVINLKNTGGREIILEPYAVKIEGNKEEKYRCLLQTNPEEILFPENNIVAATFDEEGVYEFDLAEDLEVIIALRNYPEDVIIWLDEKPLNACNKSNLLPAGFNGLYKQTQNTVLERGRHKLIYKNTTKNFYKYLPEIMFIGDFYCKGNVFATKNAENGNVSRYGKWLFRFNAHIPADKKLAISIEGTDKPMQLYAGEEPIGTRIVYPYVWNIPSEYFGQNVQFTLESASDLSNIFGDISAIEKIDGTPGWCSGFTPVYQKKIPEIKVNVLEII